MIICPNCRHEEISGAIFCSECGTLLEGLTGFTTQNIPPVPPSEIAETVDERIQTAPYSEAEVSLCIVETGQIIPLDEREEFTLGRSAEGQPILPDIDLAPYRAYENGVSRLHASIKKQGRQLIATDLGSVNGTRLNGQKIPPHKPCPLNHGDILTLGKLKIQILIRR
jgi:hypothetical protein